MRRLVLVGLLALAACGGVAADAPCVDTAIWCDAETHCLLLCDMGTWRTVECRACGQPGTQAWSPVSGTCSVPRWECPLSVVR